MWSLQLHHVGTFPGKSDILIDRIHLPQDLAGRPGPVWDHVIVCDKGHPISFRTLGSGVKINRFPNTAAICRKDRLCTNFHAMQKKFGKKIFNFIPKVDREMLLSQFKEYFYLLLILSDLPPS